MRIGLIALLILIGLTRAKADDTTLDRWRDLDAATRSTVLTLARRAFDTYATRRETIDPPARPLPPLLQQRVGVFVSAMRHGAPRCCMGTLYPLEPDAAHEIIANAVAAAGRDRRFPPIKPNELKTLTLIVSVVGRPRPITAAEAARLDPTRDGLAVRFGDRYGVVLSGETTQADRMIAWARIRAGAGAAAPIELFRLDVVRFVEPRPLP